jgi:hypothetical protein
VSYRDDVDTLYTRAMILQRELDAATAKLETREAELAKLRSAPFEREDTSPGMRLLRDLPEIDEARSRLIHSSPELPPLPMPDWSAISRSLTQSPLPPPVPLPPRNSIHELVRVRVALLSPEDLLLVGKIVEELTDAEQGMDEDLRKRLRWLASEISGSRT